MAIAQQRHGEIRVFGDGIDVEGAGCAHCGDTPGTNCSGNDADCTESIESTALKVLAGDVFEGLPARPEIDAVANFGVTSDGAYFGIEEMRHHASDGVGSNDGIGIDADEEFSVSDVIETVVEGFGFAAVGLGEDDDFAGGFFAGKDSTDNFEGAIFGAVVDDDDAKIGIVGIERALDSALNDFFFVIGGNEHRNFRPVGGDFGGRTVDVRGQAVVDGEYADGEETAGHENVAQEKDQHDAAHGGSEKPPS